ncbi:uncharacterized protein MELLADRAFT_111471 [Melampsora larici-populina 98AG31]|uniref:Uncharacterized protein n=1 Tax=Melampsora larici-populina (strain 98AG31 / pathotype 3-4-7) TaxID=747676 RepID=F4S3A5_MELLP|nr:uncharacterized protein MELLADRAFT_111471 [Melampsora larici-populina 98AG31]EGG00876.1 hypothetical protein MELLADRAFT_111471 [Melampsora larici-populina 98AG31]
MTKSKPRKNSGQGPNSPTSPSSTTDPNIKQVLPGQTSSATHASVAAPSQPIGLTPSHTLPPPPTGFTQDVALLSLIQSLPADLRVFLDPNYEEKYNKITKVLFYRILLHFDPATSSRPSHRKPELNAAFKEKLLPRLLPFLTRQPSAPMDTDDDPNTDFNPLARKTTRKMLTEAIKRKVPSIHIPAAARRDGLLVLYKQHVDKDLVLPGEIGTIRKPHLIKPNAVENQDMEDLRLAIQCHAPTVFVHTIPMTHKVLVNCYMHFVHGVKLDPGTLFCRNVCSETQVNRIIGWCKCVDAFSMHPRFHLLMFQKTHGQSLHETVCGRDGVFVVVATVVLDAA